jgi:hypothetical protein
VDRSRLGSCFAGICDRRLPEVGEDGGTTELETILDLCAIRCRSGVIPCIDPIFGPTAPSFYWSSVTRAADPSAAWFVDFGTEFTTEHPFFVAKNLPLNVRGVRTGP